MYDSDGAPIYVGDTVEYFQKCYASDGEFRSSNFGELEQEYKKEAKKAGFTIFEYTQNYHNINKPDWVWRAYKPCINVVRWDDYACTFAPLINYQEDYHLNCFRLLINNYKDDRSAYCRVIKKWNETLTITAQIEKP